MRRAFWIVSALLLVLGLQATLLALALHLRHERLAQVQSQLDMAAVAAVHQIEGTVLQIERTLQGIAGALELYPQGWSTGNRYIHRLLIRRKEQNEPIDVLSLVGVDGVLRNSSSGLTAIPRVLAEEDYVEAHFPAATTLFVGTKDKLDGKQAIVISRAVSGANGTLGVVVAEVPSDALYGLLRDLVLPGNPSLVLRRADGLELVCDDRLDCADGARRAEAALPVTAAREQEHMVGTASSSRIGIEAAVVVAQDDVLQEWRRLAVLVTLFGVAGAIFIGSGGAIVYQQVERRRQALRQAARDHASVEQRVQERTAELQVLARTDPLTGLLNRRAFAEEGKKAIQLARRHQRNISLLMIDIDHFKNINDTYGHPFGDVVLERLSRLLQNEAREADVVARLGGEEFAIMLPETDEEGALRFAQRLVRAAPALRFDADGKPVAVTLSIGLSTLNNGDNLDLEKMLGEADAALYRAKESGRNRAVAADRLAAGETA